MIASALQNKHFSRKIFKNLLDKENDYAIIELKMNDDSILEADMQFLKDNIKTNIYKAGIEEFSSKGFRKAKMQDIAKRAGISVGLTYSYYQNKEDLFAAIVDPIYREIIRPIQDDDRKESEKGDPSHLFEEELTLILQLFKDKREIFLMLFDLSKGTRYEKAKEEIIKSTKEHIRQQLGSKINRKQFEINEEFYHILANNFIEGLLEIARHYRGNTWAKNMLRLLMHQYYYGVSGFHR